MYIFTGFIYGNNFFFFFFVHVLSFDNFLNINEFYGKVHK
jgi:hypothetical protein